MSEERKPSLGEFLKSERERRGLTIEQTSSATKIGLKVLKQLEGDRYSELPALPFVRGFVRNYAKFLGIDGEKLLVEYASFLDEHSRERPKRDVGHSGYAFERPEGEQSKKILWGVMASMLVFGGAVVFVFKPSLRHRHHGHLDRLRSNPGEDSDSDTLAEGPTTASPTPELSSSIPSGVPSAVAVAVTPSGTPVVAASAVPVPTPSPSVVVAAHVAPSPTPSPEAPFIPPKTPLVLAPEPPPEEKVLPSPSPSVVVAAVPSPKPTPTHTPKPVPTVAAAPSPVPPPKPKETVAAAPSPVVTPASTPVAVSTPAAPSTPGVMDPAEDQKKDPLQTGTNYPLKEVKYKLIIRTKADVWVRYQCDDKKLMKFALKKGKILVLRGRQSVRFQTSNPDSITFQASGGPERVFSATPEVFEYSGNSTVVYPKQDREKINDLFKVGPALPHTDAPTAEETNGAG